MRIKNKVEEDSIFDRTSQFKIPRLQENKREA